MRKTFSVLGLSAALASGCGSPEKAPTGHNKQPPPASTATNNINPQIKVYHGPANIPKSVLKEMRTNPLLKSLNEYRSLIYEKRRAHVILGACATWPNASGGFTATINPGSAEFKTKMGARVSYLLFSAYDPKNPSGLQQMDGPKSVHNSDGTIQSDDQYLALELYGKDPKAHAADVHLTEQPVIDQAERVYFKDRKSGSPVMLTGLAPTAQYTEINIHAACAALLHHKTLPGILQS